MINHKTDILLKKLSENPGSDDLLVGATESGQAPNLTFGSNTDKSWLPRWASWTVASVKPEEQYCLRSQLQDLADKANTFLHTKGIQAKNIATIDDKEALTKNSVARMLKTVQDSHKYAYDTLLTALVDTYMDVSTLKSEDKMVQEIVNSVLKQLSELDLQTVKDIVPAALLSFSEFHNKETVQRICTAIAEKFISPVSKPPSPPLAITEPPPAKPAEESQTTAVKPPPFDTATEWVIQNDNHFSLGEDIILNRRTISLMDSKNFHPRMGLLMGVLRYGHQHGRHSTQDITRLLNNFGEWLTDHINQQKPIDLSERDISLAIYRLDIIQAAFPEVSTADLRKKLQNCPTKDNPTPNGETPKDYQQLLQVETQRTQEQEALAKTQVVRHRKNLGQGHFGDVNHVVADNQDRAHKTLRKAPQGEQQIEKEKLQNLEKERNILTGLQHPHILKETGRHRSATEEIKIVHEEEIEDDYIRVDRVDDGLAGIQTELVDGSFDLDKGLFAQLPRKKQLQCCLQSLEAVAYMNDQGVAHLDLKPENILYSHKDGVKVADFGLAVRMETTEDGANQVTHPGKQLPKSHSAPERVYKLFDGAKTDAWSLAVTMAELLLNDSPMKSEEIKQGFEQHYPSEAPKGFLGLINDWDIISVGVLSFLERNQEKLGQLHDMFLDMLQPYPHNRSSASEVLAEYGHILRQMIDEAPD